MAEDFGDRDKLMQDLGEIERLVKEGVAYARSAHGNVEKASRIDLSSFIESLVYDYQDTGKDVAIIEMSGGAIMTRPHALRRVLTNLIDNALKFAGSAEIEVQRRAGESIVVRVLDRGPGIPDDQLEAVLKPFFRLSNRAIAIPAEPGSAWRLPHSLPRRSAGSLTLRNRDGGGLAAEIVINRTAA